MKAILKNERGVALLMVTTAIVLLSVIMITFSYDSNINKLRSYNIEDRTQAKLVAESGLKFAMVRLRLYKEAYNFLENNKSAKDIANQQVINSLWNFPFAYPIPSSANMNQIQKEVIKDFQESAILDGNMQLTIQNISNRLNFNMLRLNLFTINDPKYEPPTEEELEYSAESQLVKSLTNAIQNKSEKDENFSNEYFGTDTQTMANIVKYNVSDQEALQGDVGAQGEFDAIELNPKFAPMSSFSEIYTLPKWNDDLVELIKNEFTPYGSLMIDLNKLTDKTIRLLIPNLEEQDILDFFEYKNNADNPVYFNNVDDFKNYWVNRANIISRDEIDEIFAKFDAQGLKFGPSPSLFKVISVGQKGRATYTLTAIVSIPAQPKAKPKENTNATNGTDGTDGTDGADGTDGSDGSDGSDGTDGTDGTNGSNGTNSTTGEADKKTLLLNPRILEVIVN